MTCTTNSRFLGTWNCISLYVNVFNELVSRSNYSPSACSTFAQFRSTSYYIRSSNNNQISCQRFDVKCFGSIGIRCRTCRSSSNRSRGYRFRARTLRREHLAAGCLSSYPYYPVEGIYELEERKSVVHTRKPRPRSIGRSLYL